MNFFKKILVRYPSTRILNKKPVGVLFLFRSIADFDHMVPIAYKFQFQRPDCNIIFACVDPEFDFRATKLNDFVVNKLKLVSCYYEELAKPTLFHVLFLKLIHFFIPSTHRDLSHTYKSVLFKWLNKSRFKYILYDDRYHEYILVANNINRVVIDTVNTRDQRLRYRLILPIVKRINIKVICIAHGIATRFDVLLAVEKSVNLRMRYKWVDFFLTNNEGSRKHLLSGGISSKDIKVVGSSHFCNEWLEVWGDFCGERKDLKCKENILKVIMIEPPEQYVIFEKYVKLVNMLAANDNVELRILPHPRSKKIYMLRNICPNLIEDISTPSSVMVKWCDIAIAEYSSLSWECLERNKPLLVVDYITDRKSKTDSIFREDSICIYCSNINDVVENIKRGIKKALPKPLGNSNYQKLRGKIIYGDCVEDNVLESYVHEIML